MLIVIMLFLKMPNRNNEAEISGLVSLLSKFA